MSTSGTDRAEALLDAAAAVLDDEGRDAVTARRLGREIGASSMAVYTHFGGMEELFGAIWRRGFARFGAALESATASTDPVADWMLQGWAYRRFALDNRHLYRVMFDEGLVAVNTGSPSDRDAAAATFVALLDRIQRCADAGRWQVDDVFSAGEAVWASSHGHCTIELTGYHAALGRDPEAAMTECLRRLSAGFGDDPAATRRSLTAAVQRARRRGLVSPRGAPVNASRPAS